MRSSAEEPSAAGPRARRDLPTQGPVTIVYTDVSGSTALNQALGDAAAHELLHAHYRAVRQALAVHRGVEIKTLGDGFMLAFASARDAVECSIGVQAAAVEDNRGRSGPRMEVRVGIHTGDPIREGDEIFGEAAIIAQRVMSASSPGRILISEVARQEAGQLSAAHYLDRGVYHLKGLAEGIRLFEVVWAPEEVVTGEPGSSGVSAVRPGWHSTPFVGRKEETRRLLECLEVSEGGRSQIVLLAGEAGIGKTRLGLELFGLISRRPLTITAGRCFPSLVQPFHPFLESIRQLLQSRPDVRVPEELAAEIAPLAALAPDLLGQMAGLPDKPTARDPEEGRLRLLNGLANLLLWWSRKETLVLLIDDLQWADTHTVDLLRIIGRCLRPGPLGREGRLLMLLTCREAELGFAHPISSWLADLERDRLLVRIQLGGLDHSDVRLLLRDLRGADPGHQLTSSLMKQTEGNPYFVEEAFRDLVEGSALNPTDPRWVRAALSQRQRLPRGIKTVLDQRLSRLSDPCLELMRTAALMGPRFSFDALCAAAGSLEAEMICSVEEALGAGVLREEVQTSGVAYRFDHSLVTEVLSKQTSAARRCRLHLRIALALEQLYGAQALEHAGELANHLMRAGSLAPAGALIRYAVRAGDVAMALYAHAEADRFYVSVLEAMDRTAETSELERADVQGRRVPALGRLGLLDEARALADVAIETLVSRGKQESAARVGEAMASALILHARHADALPYLEKALSHRPETIDTFYGRVLATYATALDLVGRSNRMRSTAEELSGVARELKLPELRDRAVLIRRNWYANHTTNVVRARSLTRRLVQSAERRGDAWELTLVQENMGLFQFSLGRLDAALAALDRALQLAVRTGALAKIIDVHALRALCFCYRGEWDRIHEEWEQASPYVGQVPGSLRIGQLTWARARADLWLSRPAPGPPEPKATYPGMSEFETAVLAVVGLVASERGDPAATKLLTAASERHPRDGVGLNWLLATEVLAAGWVNLGRAAEAAEWYPGLAPYRSVLTLGLTALELGRIAALNGWWDRSAADFGMALRICRREGLRPYLALTLYERARMWLARGKPLDRGRAKRWLRESLDLFVVLGMRGYAERAERLLVDTQ